MEENQYTYSMIKPDGVRKHIQEQIFKRFKKAGLKIVRIKVMDLDKDILREHYSHVMDKPFYPDMEKFMLSGPVIAMVIEGPNAIYKVRELMGATDSKKALPGTIRGDYGNKQIVCENIIHGSDSEETAAIEIARFFNDLTIDELKGKQKTR